MTASTAVANGRRRAVLAPLLTLALIVLLARAASLRLLNARLGARPGASP